MVSLPGPPPPAGTAQPSVFLPGRALATEACPRSRFPATWPEGATRGRAAPPHLQGGHGARRALRREPAVRALISPAPRAPRCLSAVSGAPGSAAGPGGAAAPTP